MAFEVDLEDAINDIAAYISKAFRSNDLIKLPESLEQPLRSVSQPTNGRQLKPLQKLFESKDQLRVFQLAPSTFAGIVSIALYFPCSTIPEKLLHAFIGALRLYHDVAAIQKVIKRYGLSDTSIEGIRDRRRAISQRLLHATLRRLIANETGKNARWTVAQVLVALVDKDADARTRLCRYDECAHLGTLLNDPRDYVSRYLVADLLRELVHHGVNAKRFFQASTAEQTILGFPTEGASTSAWLGSLQEYFADMDRTIAFNDSRQWMLRVSRAETDSARLPHLPNHSIAVISKDIHLIVPSEGVGLQVVMFPIPKDKSDVVQVTADSLEVRYSDEMGYEIHDAIKSAIKHVKLSMTSSDDAVEACQQIAVAQTQLSDEVGSMLAQVEDGTPAPKRSIAMINLWTSGDEVTPSTKAIPAREDHLNGSETQKASPLYRLSQKTKDCAEQENSHKLKQNDSGHDQAGEDPESESSFLDEVPAPSKFRDRLRASQERSNELVTSEAFNRRVDRAINKVGTSPVKSNALLEVATKRQSHLPANEDQSTTRMPAAQPQSNSAAVALGLLDGRNQRKATVRVSPVPTILSTSPKPSESTQGLPSRAHAPLDATKKDVRGPMARLASSQAKGLPPSSKKDSDSASSLKRKGRPSGKKDPEDTIDWDEGLRDDDSDEEPIKKKTKAGKTNASTKSTKTKKTQGKKTAAATKTTAAKSRKMVTDSQQASVQETATSKRERRNVKSARYVEDSGSASDEPVEEIVEPTNKGTPSGSLKKPETQDKLSTQGQSNESRSDRAVPAQHRTTPASQTAPNPVAKVCSAQASTGDVVKSSGKEGRMSLVPAVVIASSPATSRRGKVTVVASVIQSAQTNLNGQDTAQDSYPMTTEAKDGRIAAPGISFDTKLLELVGPNDDKENMPPPSASPFGSKKQFIANVNSTRSGSQEELLTAPFPSKAKTGSFVASSKPLHKKRPIPGSDKTNAHTNQPPSAADHYRQTVNQTDPLALGDLVRDDAEPVDDTVDPELRLDKPSNDPSFGPRIDDQPIGLQTGRMARTIAGFDAAKPFEEAKATKTPRRPSKPRRQNSSPLTSEKSSQKPSVVHFSAAGPLNQGTSSVNRQKTSTSIIRAPGETSRHSRFKQQTAEYQASEDTPSRPPPTKTYHVTNATSKVLDKDSSLVNPDYVSVVEDTEVALDTADAHNDAKRLQGPVQVAPARPDPQMSRHSGQRDKPLESQRKSDARSDASMSPRTQADNAAARSPADATSSTHRYATSRPRETPREFPPTVHMSKGPSTVEISDIEMGRAARSLPRDPLQVAEHTQSNDLSATELLQHEVDTFMAVVRDSGSQSTSPPPSPETEEEEPSEYEEPESAEVSVEREDRSLLPTKAKSQSSISPTTPQLDDTRPQIPQHRGPDIIRPSSKRQHGSIGLSDLIQKRFPQGRTSIDTTIFRDQPPGDDDRSAGTTTRNKRVKLAVGGTEDTELKVKRATVVDATSLAGITRSSLEHMDSGMPKHEMTMAMPPPRRKSGPVTKSQTISHERTRSSMPGTIIARHRVCDDNAGEIETTSGLLPLRVTQSAARTPQLPEATQLPESTPVPFHERIGAHKTETEHGDRLEPARVQLNSRRKTNSFLSQDAADRTLINEADIPGYSFYYRPDLRAREEREMTERTEDSETPAREYVNATKDETRSWSSAGRQIRDLGTEFNSIYNKRAVQLEEAEDAIANTVEGFREASLVFVDELVGSWNKRMDHENGKIHEQIASRQQDLQMTIDSVGGVEAWGELISPKTMEEKLTTRNNDVKGLLDGIMGMVGDEKW